MPIRCPTLIVHHQAGKEYWAEQEIGDILFPHDPGVIIERTDYRGVLLVYTSIPPNKAYRLITREVLTSIDRVIPVEGCFKVGSASNLEEAIETVFSVVKRYECVRASVSLRGWLKKYSRILSREITENLHVEKSCRTILYVESIDSYLLYGLVSG
ncbi:MAG: hypothetical protein GSR75_00845 [Desulfurococcales archaeon]|nr:hypothetical protein [Desulfurococcales archaeon]